MASRYRPLSWLRRPAATQASPLAIPVCDAESGEDAGPVYRLRNWPPLPGACRTARVFRVLDLMSRRPLSQQWLHSSSGLTPAQIDELILNLVVHRAVDISTRA